MNVKCNFSRKQHQYHSQRQTRIDNQLRPVSNYFEYESVQSVLNNRGNSNRQNIPMPHMAPAAQPPPMYQDANSNSLPRQPLQQPQQPLVQARFNLNGRNNTQQHRGPFVTQVTIGNHNQQQNGTKV